MKFKNIFLPLFLPLLILSAEGNPKVIELISPNGGEILTVGERYSISWYTKNVDEISIFYSIDDGVNWKKIIIGMKSDLGSYGWKVPNGIISKIKIKIESTNSDDNTFDVSDGDIYTSEIDNSKRLNKNISNTLKILPLGNSITFDNRSNDTRIVEDKIGYRFPLYSILKDSNYTFDFIGSEHAGSNFFFPDIGYDDNAGFPGIRDNELEHLLKTGILNMPFYSVNDTITDGPYLETYTPDIILLHIGTNGNDEANGTSADDVEKILNEIDRFEDSANVNITVFLALIVNRVPNQSYVTNFNNNIENMVLDRIENPINPAYPDNIVIVDIEGIPDFNYLISPDPSGSPGDMHDILHPNDKGYRKLAQTWFNSLEEEIGKPLSILEQPNPTFAVIGDTATFKVSVSGTPPYFYQWKKDDIALIDQTDSILFYSPVELTDDNSVFSCTISNSFSSINSENAQLSTILLEQPDQLIASINVDNEIELVWNDNSDNEEGFIVWRSSTLNPAYIILDSIQANSNNFLDDSLTDGLKYTYKVSSFIEFGESISNEEATIITPLNPPTNLVGALDGNDNIVLDWDDNSENENHYVIEAKADHPDSIFYFIDSVFSNVISYTDESPKFFTPYIYRVYAVSDDTISIFSNNAVITVVNISRGVNTSPLHFSLKQNYPNPFNPITTIEYVIPEESNVSLKIYNSLGQLVQIVIDSKLSGGIYNTNFDATSLNSGVYFYVLTSKGTKDKQVQLDVKKLLLLK